MSDAGARRGFLAALALALPCGFWIWAYALRPDPASASTWFAFAACATPALLLGRLPRGSTRRSLARTACDACLLAALAIGAWLASPWLLPAAVAGLAVRGMALVSRRSGRWWEFWQARSATADLLLLQAFAFVFYLWAEPYLQWTRVPDWLATPLARLFVDAGETSLGVGLSTQSTASWVHGVSLNHFALFTAVPIWIAVLALAKGVPWRRTLGCLAAALAGCGLFWLLSGLLSADRGRPFFHEREWQLLIYCHAPGLLLIAWLLGRDLAPRLAPAGPARGATLGSLGASLLCGALIYAALFAHDPGTRKPGRILIDEAHSKWEPSDVDFGLDAFGTRTVYSFVWFKRILERYYPSVELNHDPLTPERLSSVDVLVVKTPTSRYSEEEVDAVEAFVQAGGGLWLIGDHTNVFGMTTYLNDFARRFGMRFETDALGTIGSYAHQVSQRPALDPHPSIRHVRQVDWMTSCSIQANPLVARSAFVGSGLYRDRPGFKDVRLFGNMEQDGSEPFGRFIQATAVRSGAGRVLTFTDSTVFSTFALCLPGWSEWVVGSAEWLNRTNRWPWLNTAAIWGALASLALLLILLARAPSLAALSGSVAALALGWILAQSACHAFDAQAYPVPEEEAPAQRIAYFFTPGSSYLPIHPVRRPHDERLPNDFHSLLVAFQRMGRFPEVLRRPTAIGPYEAVVTFSGQRSVPLEDLEQYLRDGGKVFLIRSSSDPRGSRLAKTLDALRAAEPGVPSARYAAEEVQQASLEASASVPEPSGCHLPSLAESVVLSGGEIVASNETGAILAASDFGEGRLYVVSATELFSTARLGSPFEAPTEQRYRLHLLLEELLEDA